MTEPLLFLIEIISAAFAGFYIGLLFLLVILGYYAIALVGIIIGIIFVLGVD